MARRCSWDVNGVAYEWFDVGASNLGWWDRDAVPPPPTPPPPPPPTPAAKRPTSQQGGGGARIITELPDELNEDKWHRRLEELLEKQPIEKWQPQPESQIPDEEDEEPETGLVIVEVPVVVEKKVPTTVIVQAAATEKPKPQPKKKKKRATAVVQALRKMPVDREIVYLQAPPTPMQVARPVPWGAILLAVSAGVLLGYLLFRKPAPTTRQPRKPRQLDRAPRGGARRRRSSR